MKRYLLTAIALGTQALCQAQAERLSMAHPMEGTVPGAPPSAVAAPMHPYAAQLAAQGSGNKTTAVKSRLKSTASYQPSGQVFVYKDSLYYEYSGERGGDLNSPGGVACDRYTTYTYNVNTSSFGLNYKATYTYNSNDRQTKELREKWNGTAWQNTFNSVSSYDAAGNITDEVLQNWDNVTQAWVNAWHYIHTYDGMNNETLRQTDKWNTGTATWDKKTQDIYTYNGAAMTSREAKNWDAVNNVWKATYRNEYQYNSNGLLETYLYYVWDANTSSLVESQRYTSTYTATNHISVYLVEQKNGGSWQNNGRTTYSYDAADNEVGELHEVWNANAWVDDWKTLYTYNTAGNRLTSTFITYQANTNTWKNQTRNLYEYDAKGNMLKNTEQEPDINNNAVWVNKLREIMAYNGYDQLLSRYTQTYIANAWTLMANDYQDTYTYEDYTVGVGQLLPAGAAMQVYPNPAAQYLAIDLALPQAATITIALADAAGRQVLYTQPGTAARLHTQLDVHSLPCGVYSCTISAGNEKYTQQISILR